MGKSLKKLRELQERKFCEPRVLEINKARLDHLASLGLSLEGKSVLEVGSGIGMLTGFFEKLGCDILSTEGREANMVENLHRHPHRKEKVKVVDLAKSHSHRHLGKFDIVFCYGVLYHLGDPKRCIADMSEVCEELFLLSTRVYKTDNARVNRFEEKSFHNLRSVASRPSRNWIMVTLKKHYEFVYLTKKQPNFSDFFLSWPAPTHKARAVFVASRIELDLSTLTTELLMRQERYEG